MSDVRIYYRRPPTRESVFTQTLVLRSPEVVITFMENSSIAKPVRIGGRVVLDTDAPAVWFSFPGAWHDIGRFHLSDGSFTGIYTNIQTPIEFRGADAWETTDLFLDLWHDPLGNTTLLDEDEFEDAVMAGWIDSELERMARAETKRIQRLSDAGAWPPPVVEEWTLERVLEELAERRVEEPAHY